MGVQLLAGPELQLVLPVVEAGLLVALTVGIRGSCLRVSGRVGDVLLAGVVELAEISGSDTFVHVGSAVGDVVFPHMCTSCMSIYRCQNCSLLLSPCIDITTSTPLQPTTAAAGATRTPKLASQPAH